MSNTQWFYADAQQQQLGPVTFEQIQQLAASGQIQDATLIWNQSMPNWTAASQVQGVFGGTPAAPAAAQENPYAAPNTGNPMAAPTGGSYPIPSVKKCSFTLFLLMFLVGMVLYLGGVAKFFFDAKESISDYETQSETFEQIETREDAERASESRSTEVEVEVEPPSFAGMGVMFLGLLILLIAFIINLTHLHRAWTLLQSGRARTTPGKGAWLNLIPLFNFYWMFVGFYGWAQDWNRIRSSHSNLANMPSVPQGVFLAAPICFVSSLIPLVGIIASLAFPFLYIIMAAKICKVVNAMADANPGQR